MAAPAHCNILTLFPEVLDAYLHHSIFGRAQKKYTIQCINIRDFAANKHNRVDDTLAGGTAGMLIQAPVIQRAIQHVQTPQSFVIHASPRGKLWTQKHAESMAKKIQQGGNIIFVCGHYEGIDQRCIDTMIDAEFSIGPYILTGGETAALAMVESIIRLLPDVLGSSASHERESHTGNLTDRIEHPQYTKPEIWNEMKIPAVLLSWHHQKQEDWRDFGSFDSPYTSIDRYPDLCKIPGTCDPTEIQSYRGSAQAIQTVQSALMQHRAFQKKKKPQPSFRPLSWENDALQDLLTSCNPTQVFVWHPQETQIHQAFTSFVTAHSHIKLPWNKIEPSSKTALPFDYCLCWDGHTISLINVWQKRPASA